MLLLAGFGLTEASGVTHFSGTVLRLFTPEGILVVEVEDPAVSVNIDGEELTIKGAGIKEIRMKAGQYKVQASKDGKVVRQDLVTITKGGKEVVRIGREAHPAVPIDSDRKAAEYALSIKGTIKVHDYPYVLKTGDNLPDGPVRLVYAYLAWNPQVNDAALAHFAGCNSLIILHLEFSPVTDVGLAYLKDCKNLKSLNLSGQQVTAAGLAHFKDCKNLTQLRLYDTRTGDEGLACFKDCKNLEYLLVNSTKLSDDALACFKNCTNLSILDLSHTQASDDVLAHFKDCKNLTELVLDNTQVSDRGLALFKDCKNLKRLVLQKTRVTATGIDELKKALVRCKIEWDEGVIEPMAEAP